MSKNLRQISNCANAALNNVQSRIPSNLNVDNLPVIIQDCDDKEFNISDVSVRINDQNEAIAIVLRYDDRFPIQ